MPLRVATTVQRSSLVVDSVAAPASVDGQNMRRGVTPRSAIRSPGHEHMPMDHALAVPHLDPLAPAHAALASRGLTRRTVEAQGTTLPYLEAGQGPTLLLIHGAPQWSFTWRGVMAELAPRFRCIAPDMPGFGLSPSDAGPVSLHASAQAVERLVDALQLRDITLVANDTGGPVGFTVAGRRPERFVGLVAAGTFGYSLDEFTAVRAMLRVVGSRFGRWLNRRLNLIPRLAAGPGTPGASLDADERRALLAPFARASTRDACGQLLAALVRERPLLARTQANLARLADRPVLSLFGEHDRARKAGFPDKFARLFPDHQLHVIAGANHFPQEDDPRAVAAHIQAWHGARVGR